MTWAIFDWDACFCTTGSCGSDSCSGSISGAARFRDAGNSPRDCCGVGVDGPRVLLLSPSADPKGEERKPNARRRRVGLGVNSTGTVTATGLLCSTGAGLCAGGGETVFLGGELRRVRWRRRRVLLLLLLVVVVVPATGRLSGSSEGARLPSREAAIRLLRRGAESLPLAILCDGVWCLQWCW